MFLCFPYSAIMRDPSVSWLLRFRAWGLEFWGSLAEGPACPGGQVNVSPLSSTHAKEIPLFGCIQRPTRNPRPFLKGLENPSIRSSYLGPLFSEALALTRPVYSRSGRFHAGLRMHLFRHILGCRHIIICCLCGIAGAWHTSSGKLETKYLRHCII